MPLREKLREPSVLLFATVAAALLALGLARVGAEPMVARAAAAPVLALAVRSLLWGSLAAWVGTGLGERPRVGGLLPLSAGLGLGTGAFGGFALWLAASRLPVAAPLMPDPASLPPLWFGVLALVALLLAPLGEEWLFRGTLFAGIREAHGPRAAMVASALAFALFHLHPVHLVVAAVAGLALGWLREHSGRLWPCVFAHALHNALWLISASS
jgi:ABC-2 type transport system permease protein